jgi:hypothetical protein
VTSDGGVTVSARGVCWGTAANPDITASCTSNSTGTGSFVSSITGLSPGQIYHVRSYATNSLGTAYGTDVQFTTTSNASKIGVFRNGSWYIDLVGNYTWSGCGPDGCYDFGTAGDIPIVGDWNGNGNVKLGVFTNGTWYLDINGNNAWDAGVDATIPFGAAGDIPIVGDWNGTGKSNIGVFRNGTWYLDLAGTGTWVGCNTTSDACYSFGQAGDIPVVGDWNGTGKSNIGLFRNGTWYLDLAGTGTWVGCNTTSNACYSFGQAGDIPVVGNWNGSADGKAKIGVFRNGTWYLDYPGSGKWIGCGAPGDATKDACFTFGIPGDVPVVTK